MDLNDIRGPSCCNAPAMPQVRPYGVRYVCQHCAQTAMVPAVKARSSALMRHLSGWEWDQYRYEVEIEPHVEAIEAACAAMGWRFHVVVQSEGGSAYEDGDPSAGKPLDKA